jgi:hypothetical protein
MLYGPGVRDNTITDEGYSEPNIEYIAQKVHRLIWELKQRAIPEPPSFLFEWDEEQDMIDMTGLQDIRLTS